ncbi:MAG: AAA family ATPase [Colwellia sp.]|jgi:Predicted ATP-binding protein involved in virulence
MTSSDLILELHSGKRLQKLREFQGLSLSELSSDLEVSSTELKSWEDTGIPEEYIALICQTFEVSTSMFTGTVNNLSELDELANSQLFPRNTEELKVLLEDNKNSKSPILNLSGLGLSDIPIEIFDFYWLVELDVSDNNIKEIHCGIVLLRKLKVFDIGNNLLRYLPGVVFSFSGLTEFNSNGNPLSLQTPWLRANQSFDIYSSYMHDKSVTIIMFDDLNMDNLNVLNKNRGFLETENVLMIIVDKQHSDVIQKYTKILNYIYISDVYSKDKLVANTQLLLKNINLPLFLLFNSELSQQQTFEIEEYVLSLSPSNTSLQSLSENFKTLTSDFQNVRKEIIDQGELNKIKLVELSLTNIGVYEEIVIPFNEDLTVLVGLNGAGKTTILKSLALCILGPEDSGVDDEIAANLLRIVGMENSKISWRDEGVIQLKATVNDQCFYNTVNLSYNYKSEKVEISGSRFDALYDSEGNLSSLMLGIGEQRNSTLKGSTSLGREVLGPKVRDLLPLISGEDQACISHYASWLGNLALSVNRGEIKSQKAIDISFSIFSELMQEKIKFAGLTRVDPLELWVEHQNPKQVVPLRLASQGYQAVMGWVGYIVQRMFEAYGDVFQPLNQHAIIIIDEIDQLLHVKWQQKIINTLSKEFFPNTQWIVTTHSPMVISGLDESQVLQLHQLEGVLVAEPNTVDLWLWQFDDIVRFLFDVSPDDNQFHERKLVGEINLIKAMDSTKKTESKLNELEKLEGQLIRIQKSRAFVDEIYAEQLKLKEKEQELSILIEQLSQNSKV